MSSRSRRSPTAEPPIADSCCETLTGVGGRLALIVIRRAICLVIVGLGATIGRIFVFRLMCSFHFEIIKGIIFNTIIWIFSKHSINEISDPIVHIGIGF